MAPAKPTQYTVFGASALLSLAGAIDCYVSAHEVGSQIPVESGLRRQTEHAVVDRWLSLHDDNDETSSSSSSSDSLPLSSSSMPQHFFQVGEIVQVYDPTMNHELAPYAFPAQIQTIQYEDDAETIVSSYTVLPGIGLESLSSLPPSSISPIVEYESGSQAMCDFGAISSVNDGMDGMQYVPRLMSCTILDFMEETRNKGNGGWYSVRVEDEDSMETRVTQRPVSKILRIVGDNSPASVPSNGAPLIPFSEPAFQVGSLIEIYDPSSHSAFAFPATVTATTYHPDEDLFEYTLVHGITKATLKNVEERLLHEFEPQESGSNGLCNVASPTSSAEGKNKISMQPCTIVSHSDEDQSYQITWKKPESGSKSPLLRSARRDEVQNDEDEDNVITAFVPYLNFQRFVEH